MKKTITIALIAFLLGGATIFGVKKILWRGHHGKKFERYDTNADGVITKDEVLKRAEERFTKMDANGDQKVTKQEAKEYYKSKKKRWKK